MARYVTDRERVQQLLSAPHQVDLGAKFGQAAVHVARDRGAEQVVGHFLVARDQVLHVLGGNAVAERVFERDHVEAGDVAPHQRQQAEHLAFAAHVEHQFFADVGADAQLHRSLLHDVEGLGGAPAGSDNDFVLGEVLQRHRTCQRANLRQGKKLEGRNLLQKIDDRLGYRCGGGWRGHERHLIRGNSSTGSGP